MLLPTERPKIENGNKLVLSPPGGNVSIPCKASGVPHPIIRWFRNTTGELKEIIQDSKDNQELLLKNIGLEDQGIYICSAENKLGTKLWNVTLKLGKS